MINSRHPILDVQGVEEVKLQHSPICRWNIPSGRFKPVNLGEKVLKYVCRRAALLPPLFLALVVIRRDLQRLIASVAGRSLCQMLNTLVAPSSSLSASARERPRPLPVPTTG